MPRRILVALLAAALVSGCAGASTEPDSTEVASVTISPQTVDLLRGDATQLVAVAVDGTGNTVPKTATFSSSNTTVVEVDQLGLLTAMGEGSATITATVDGKQGTAQVTVQVLDPFVSLSAGDRTTCALTAVGDAYCWGIKPVLQTWVITAQSITAASHTCALTSTGQAYCWGENDNGQLGDSTTTNRSQPVAVSGGLQFETLSAGPLHTCGVTSSGQAHCWGGSNLGSALGDGTSQRSYPGPVSGGLQFEMVSAGLSACGIVVGGAAYCWGRGNFGQIGDGLTLPRGTPVAVSGNLIFQSISSRVSSTCATTVSGDGYCWGRNDFGQIGDGTIGANQTTPALVAGGLRFQSSVEVGNFFACGIALGGGAYCWGGNDEGQLGDGTTVDRATPVPVSGGLTFVTLDVGGGHVCGITTAGSTYCWGRFGEALGNGSTTRSLIPVRVIGSP